MQSQIRNTGDVKSRNVSIIPVDINHRWAPASTKASHFSDIVRVGLCEDGHSSVRVWPGQELGSTPERDEGVAVQTDLCVGSNAADTFRAVRHEQGLPLLPTTPLFMCLLG